MATVSGPAGATELVPHQLVQHQLVPHVYWRGQVDGCTASSQRARPSLADPEANTCPQTTSRASALSAAPSCAVVATPLKLEEQIMCVTMMLFGSLLFAYLVGSFCGVAANLSPDMVRFRQDLTDLNKFLAANSIPSSLRYQLREYMHQTVYLRRNATANRLLTDLAPRLRNEVALTINEKWLEKVELINDDCEEGLVLRHAVRPHHGRRHASSHGVGFDASIGRGASA